MANEFRAEMGFARKMTPHADAYYDDFFGDHTRHDVEGDGQDDAGFAAQMDYSGTDQIVKPDGKAITIHLAQRFRRARDGAATDFSIRCRSNGHATEYHKLMLNHASPFGHTPGAYAFGITAAADPVDRGFREFYILNVNRLVDALKQDALRKERHRNFVNGKPDGTEAYYIPKDDLRSAGVVVAAWEDGDRVL